jgi:hypothetical protein
MQKTVWEWDKPFGRMVPHLVDKRKPEVVDVRDTEGMPDQETPSAWLRPAILDTCPG